MIDLKILKQELINFENELCSYKVLRYDEIPDIDLYMDQTIIFLNKRLAILKNDDDSVVTASMINNYVKAGIIPAPVSKKYSKRHLAYIIFVCFLKQILSMNDIKNIIDYLKDTKGEHLSYNFFCDAVEKSLKSCCKLIKTEKTEQNNIDVENFTLYHVCHAIANKLYAEKVIYIQQKIITEIKIEEIKKEVEKIKID